MHPHEAAAQAAQYAHSAAAEAREATLELLELEEGRNRPAVWERLHFTAARPVVAWDDSLDVPTRSFGVYNPTQLKLYVGLGGGTASANAGAVAIPPQSLVVLPIGVGFLEVGVDPADVGTLGADEAIAWGLRFATVQPAFLGSVA